jgi:hypothetical protein
MPLAKKIFPPAIGSPALDWTKRDSVVALVIRP